MGRWEVHVAGSPAPQGSKRHVGNGILLEMSKKLPEWRGRVTYAVYRLSPRPLDFPVAVTLTFLLPRPASVRRPLPSVPPDIDKLCRSTLDAMVTGRLLADDKFVVDLHATKRYAGPQEEPGVLIVVENLENVDLAPYQPRTG